MNVSEFVWHLKEWDFYPGDGVGGLDVALERAKDLHYVRVGQGAGLRPTGSARMRDRSRRCALATSHHGPGSERTSRRRLRRNPNWAASLPIRSRNCSPAAIFSQITPTVENADDPLPSAGTEGAPVHAYTKLAKEGDRRNISCCAG